MASARDPRCAPGYPLSSSFPCGWRVACVRKVGCEGRHRARPQRSRFAEKLHGPRHPGASQGVLGPQAGVACRQRFPLSSLAPCHSPSNFSLGMTVAEFKKKWSRYQGKETSAHSRRDNPRIPAAESRHLPPNRTHHEIRSRLPLLSRARDYPHQNDGPGAERPSSRVRSLWCARPHP
jgi:hypothetical protein